MRILKVIHGYPPRYSAGSEVYSQHLAHELANFHDVQVFTRQENSFIEDYHLSTELDHLDPRILINIINVPRVKYRDQYIHAPVEEYFRNILNKFNPHIVHFGHLNHLSINLPKIAKELGVLTFMTLHDYWLLCPRGQFVQRNSQSPWDFCKGQVNIKCAKQCYSGSFSGDSATEEKETKFREKWIENRMLKARGVTNYIDHFVAPSKYLKEKFCNSYKKEINKKISFLDYGFNLTYLMDRRRNSEKEFVFGYIGTHTPQKGIQFLLQAFDLLKTKKNIKLRIWGYSKEDTPALELIQHTLKQKNNVEWKEGYKNEDIIDKVFNNIDVLIVPSIWEENSPLVIHEAQQARIPVITADIGGMKEYVKHMFNGLLFKFRDTADLSQKMQMLVDDPTLAINLGEKGYLYSVNGNIPDIRTHAKKIEKLYLETAKKLKKLIPTKPGPWRITFDTNPDHCNYNCIMCECFSPYSKTKEERVKAGIKKRVMDISAIEKILRESIGSPLEEIIPSTMGEPLLYKNFERIIELCHAYNLKLNLTTNGSFPIKGAKKWSELLIPVCSDIKISINGASEAINQKIMVGSKWNDMLSNIKTLLSYRDNYPKHKNRCRVTFQVTFLETNSNELINILKLAISLGVDRVKGHHLWAHFKEIENLSMRRNSEVINKWNKIVSKLHKVAEQNLLPNGKKIKLENFHPLDENAISDIAKGGACPFLGREAWISAEGIFSPCCAPDKLRKSLGDFGYINSQTIQDIWMSDKYRQLRKNFNHHKLCISCNMRKPLSS